MAYGTGVGFNLAVDGTVVLLIPRRFNTAGK